MKVAADTRLFPASFRLNRSHYKGKQRNGEVRHPFGSTAERFDRHARRFFLGSIHHVPTQILGADQKDRRCWNESELQPRSQGPFSSSRKDPK